MRNVHLVAAWLLICSATIATACSDSESSTPQNTAGSGGSGAAGSAGSAGSGASSGSGGSSGSTGFDDEHCDPLVPTYCGFPFPSSRWLIDDETTITKKRVNLAAETLPKAEGAFALDPTPLNRSDGFSPGSTLLTHFPGATIDGLPDPNTIDLSVTTDSPTIVLDVETGELIPHFSELDRKTNDPEDVSFMIHPVRRLKDAHRYIVAIRNVKDDTGAVIDPTPAFKALRDSEKSEFQSIEDRKALYEDIFSKLDSAGIKRDNLQIAWDYTTASRENNTREMLKMRDEALELVGDQGPEYTISSVVDNPNEHIRRRILAKMKVPLYLTEATTMARMNLDADRMPKQNGFAEYEVEIQIPNSALTTPAAILQNGHGLLGRKDEGQDGYLAEFSDLKNYVTVAVDWNGFSEADYQQVFYTAKSGSLDDFATFMERQQQGMLNALLAMRMMKGRFVNDPNVQFDYGGEMKSAIDPSLGCYYRGDSLGGIMGTTYMSLSTDVTRGLLSVPGFPFTLLLDRSENFGVFAIALGSVFENGARHVHYVSALVQMLWDRIEPDGYAPYIRGGDMLPGTPEHEVLVHVGIGDYQVTNLGSHILARTVGATNLTPVNRSVFELPEAAGPLSGAAVVEYEFGLPPIPTINVPPGGAPDDNPHNKVRSLSASYNQADEFFRTGMVNSFCEGPCDPE